MTTNQRIEQLDVLRGFAVFGILLMNIKGFALIGAMYVNPLAMGPLPLPEWLLFGFERLLVDYKFLGLFSLLFGAGIALLDEKLRLNQQNTFSYQFRRLCLLAVIGACHALLLWYGDILLSYALCGCIALLFVRLPVKAIVVAATVFAAAPLWYFITRQISIEAATNDAIQSMVSSFWVPSAASIESEVSSYLGSLSEQFDARLGSVKFMMLYLFPRENLWKSTSFMLLGIALYKSGFFTGAWRQQAYLKFGLGFASVGLLVTGLGMARDIVQDFAIQTSLYQGRLMLYLGSIPQALGYAGLFYFIHKSIPSSFSQGMAAVGRMALTNYLMQTVICTFIFYGWGLGLYGQFGVLSLLFFVIGIWVLQYLLSLWWLRRYRQGPLEWAWRKATQLLWPYR